MGNFARSLINLKKYDESPSVSESLCFGSLVMFGLGLFF